MKDLITSASLVAATIIAASGIIYLGYTAARVRDLERRLHALDQRVAKAEQQIKPHVQLLPPYVPNE